MPRFGVCLSRFFGLFAVGVVAVEISALATGFELRRELLEHVSERLK